MRFLSTTLAVISVATLLAGAGTATAATHESGGPPVALPQGPATGGEAGQAVAPRQHIVRMKFDEDEGTVYFEPSRLEIKSGDVVIWIQDDAVNEHNVVSYPDGIPEGTEPFMAPLLTALGQTWSYRFTKPGTYRYHCHPHEALGMRGEIIVDRESRADEFRKPGPEEMHAHGDDGAGPMSRGAMDPESMDPESMDHGSMEPEPMDHE